MHANQFDALLRSLSASPSRRGALRLLVGSALGSVLTLGPVSTDAKKGKAKGKGKNKKGKKVTLCHNGQTITVSKSAQKAHLAHGDGFGPCPPAPACSGLNTPCTADAQCCSGICDSYSDRCSNVRIGCDPAIAGQCPNQGICCESLSAPGEFICSDNPATNTRGCGTTCGTLINCQNFGAAARCQAGACCCLAGSTCTNGGATLPPCGS